MRALLIAAGIFFISRFHWVVYPFAALTILAAGRLLRGEQKERQLVLAACAICSIWVARIIPVTTQIRGDSFWIENRHLG